MTAGDYDDVAGPQADNARLLAILAGPLDGRAVLDVGCGTGLLLHLARRRGARYVTGVDISAGMVAAAAQRLGDDARLVVGDFLNPAIEVGEGFDIVLSNAALHWMRPRLQFALTRIVTAMADDAVLAVATAGTANGEPSPFEERVTVAARAAGLSPSIDGRFSDRRLSPETFAALATESGVTVSDAFLVTRTIRLTVDAYVTWLDRTGSPWHLAGGARRVFAGQLRQIVGDEIAVEHVSTVAVGRKAA